MDSLAVVVVLVDNKTIIYTLLKLKRFECQELPKGLRMMIQGQKKSELVLYVTLWAILFAASAFSVYSDEASFEWVSLLNTWKFLAMFCITFFIHNSFLAPWLVYGNKKWQYGVSVTVLLALFFGYQMIRGSHEPPRREMPREKMERAEMKGDVPPPPPKKDDGLNPMKAKPFGGPSAVACTIMLLLLGLNVGTKYYFKSQDDRKRMKELERDNLNQQLQYLKYQINPHFFMNTLNNIHALVDIDPEEAKHTIEVLSKLMRYVLYDADKPMAPLQKELDFLGHYINLMRIRYTDKVRISVSLPVSVPDVQVPSLLFATFVENAFKHGVSYQKESFIEVSVRVDEISHELDFLCNNSKKPEAEEKKAKAMQATKDKLHKRQGGVGLQNAIKRLDLIYGHDYELKVDANAGEYRLLLRLPFL